MGCEITEWTARSHDDGSHRVLAVTGRGTCTTTGYRLELAPTNKGIVDDPRLIALALTLTPPDVGEDTITSVSVEYETDVGLEVTRVRIDIPEHGSRFVEIEGGATS